MLRKLPQFLKNGLLPGILTKVPFNNFCAQFTVDPFIQHYAQIKMRQHRRLYLNRTVLNQDKDITYAQIRQPNDDMISLKQKGKCPGVIERISEKVEQEIDLVLDGKKMKRLSKGITFPMIELYVRAEGKQYRCIYYKKQYHQDGFLQKVYLKEYVPGQPNKLKIPIEITHYTQNPYIQGNSKFQQKITQIDVICYNEEYPRRFYINCSYASPDRPYRVGDLVNTFPPGLIINPKNNLNNIIVFIDQKVQENQEERNAQIKQRIQKNKKKKQVKPGQTATGTTGGSTDAGSKDKPAGGATTEAKGAKK